MFVLGDFFEEVCRSIGIVSTSMKTSSNHGQRTVWIKKFANITHVKLKRKFQINLLIRVFFLFLGNCILFLLFIFSFHLALSNNWYYNYNCIMHFTFLPCTRIFMLYSSHLLSIYLFIHT